jgi:steroid 5-alpha reductase family enzyme
MNGWTALFLGAGMMAVVFALAWAMARKWENYSLVDAVWAFGIGLTGCFWLVAGADGGAKHWIAGALLALWSSRLGWHLQRRIRRAHPEEDARYLKLREVWSGRVAPAFFWFFQAQAISVVLLALPFLSIAVDPDGAWSAWETAGLIVTLIGISGEGLADSQMARFKAGQPDPRAVCREGLWRYSRHPNYFFESVIWTGFYLYACGSDWGWATVHAPGIIVFLLLRVTGIPPTEAAAVRRKGDAYRRYQETTSPFIPWPPKKVK